MKILFVGFGVRPAIEGGASLIQCSIIDHLESRGHHVDILETANYSCTELRQKVSVEPDMREGRRIYRLWNSRNWLGNRDVQLHYSLPAEEELVRQIFISCRPDVVHVHELTFLSSGTIFALLQSGAKIVKTIHNYLDLCPQRDLLPYNSNFCSDFAEGLRCVNCRGVEAVSPSTLRLSAIARAFKIAPRLRRLLSHLVKRRAGGQKADSISCDDSEILAKQYLKRRQAYISALNQCNIVHCYSKYSLELMVSYGVSRKVLRYSPVSTSTLDSIRPSPRAEKYNKEIIFHYRGGLAHNKGVDVVVKAFNNLVGCPVKLEVYGGGSRDYEQLLKAIRRNPATQFKGRYRQKDLCVLNSTVDVGIVPSRAQELFGLVGVEYLNGGVPVIASRDSGCADYVSDNSNGMLFPNGDHDALTAIIKSLANNRQKLEDLRQGVRPWHSCKEMVAGIEEIYQEAIRDKKA